MPFGISLSSHSRQRPSFVGNKQPKVGSAFKLPPQFRSCALASDSVSNSNKQQAAACCLKQPTWHSGVTPVPLALLGKQFTSSRQTARDSARCKKPPEEIYLIQPDGHRVRHGGTSCRENAALMALPPLSLCQSETWCCDQATPQEPQPESYPLDSLAYIDLVLFHTVKGRKRHFGYFRRHSETAPRWWLPDSCCLIPLHKKDHRLFLECHVYQLEAEQAGLDFIREIDSRSEARQAAETRSQFSRARPSSSKQQEADKSGLNKWASAASAAQIERHSAASRQPDSRQVGKPPRQLRQSTRRSPAAPKTTLTPDEDAGPIRRTASGTIFDKYKELQVFNIPEYEYMGFRSCRRCAERGEQRQQQQEADNGGGAVKAVSRQPHPAANTEPATAEAAAESSVQQKSAATAAMRRRPASQPPRLPREAPAMQRAAASALAPNFLPTATSRRGSSSRRPGAHRCSRTRSSAALGGSLAVAASVGSQQRPAAGYSFAPTVQAATRGIEPPFGAAPAGAAADAGGQRGGRPGQAGGRVVPTSRLLPGAAGSSSCRSRSAGPTAARYPARSSTGFTTAREAASRQQQPHRQLLGTERRRVGQAAKRRRRGRLHTGLHRGSGLPA
uniref:SET domain-containing protein n=1 Tax=Macrostomum lignano TaxID=282301 RepID=A0A1I8FF35_9PLAT